MEREEGRLSYRRTSWLLAWWYLNGARRFDVLNMASGTVQAHYLDEEGNLEYQSQDLLRAIDQMTGRLASMDFKPKVERQGMSLSAIRERTIGQIIADSIVSEDQLDRVVNDFCTIFVSLGCCGIQGNVVDHEVVGLTCDLEVVHPRELFPFPSLSQDHTKQRGLIRQRVVPLSFLKERFGKKIASNLDKLEWWEVPVGDLIGDEAGAQQAGSASITFNQGEGSMREAGANNSQESRSKDHYGVANIRELWLDGIRGTCSRYVVTCGEYLLLDEDYSTQEVYCPIGMGRFIDNGSFHGAGMFDLMYGIHREMERLLKSLFNNIRDIDRYGYIVMPAGSWNERAILREVGKGLRVVPYDADPVGDNFKPFVVQPYDSGDVPGKVAQFAAERMAQLNPIRDLIEEKGRVDSAAGLQFLDEQITRAITTPSRYVEQAFGTMYRSAVQAALREITVSPRPLPVGRLTMDLAGAVIDSEESTVSFPENPLPTISTLSFTIKERNPRSEAARKTEALEIFQLESPSGGLTDPDGFRLLALKEGLDFAIYLDEYQEAYETIIRNCLLLYGDGESPGEVIVVPGSAKPEFQMRVLSAFMTGPRMGVASPEVQNAFLDYRDTLMQAMGLVLPAAVPNPADAALLTAAGTMGGEEVPLPAGPSGMPGGAPQDPMAMMGAQGGQQAQPMMA